MSNEPLPNQSVKFTVYLESTGQIVRYGHCPYASAAAQVCYPGERVLIGGNPHDFTVGDKVGNDETHEVKLVEGVAMLVAKTA